MAGRTGNTGEPVGRRLDVLRALRSSDAPLSIAAMADELGLHPNTVRLHLDVLVSEGRVEQVLPDRRRPGRPPLLFRAVRGMDPAGPRRYRQLAEALTESLATRPDASERAVEVGRVWGQQLARAEAADGAGPTKPVERLRALLQGLGFAPELRSGRKEIGLRHCPFLELATKRSEVVCPIHLGLMRGALNVWRAPVTVERLEPFAEPDLCLVHLARTGAVR